jgi:aspartate kinase
LDVLLATGETVSTALLSMAIQNLGEQAISLSAAQCGIITNDVHSNARILEVRCQRIKKELDRGAIVVAPGFLGMTDRQEVTTLGRGGSDTTAVALAAALAAEDCETYTDVDGVYSADPRLVPGAVKLEEVGAREMQELAWHGAQVLKAEAVEFANTNGISVVVRSTFNNDPGTLVRADDGEVYRPRRAEVAGVSGRKDLVRITVAGTKPDEPQGREIFAAVSKYDLIFGNAGCDGEPIELFISTNEIPDPEAFTRELELRFNGATKTTKDLGAVSLVGFGLGSRPAALSEALAAMGRIGAPVIKSFTGRESLSFVIPRAEVDSCVKRMHHLFVESHWQSSQAVAAPLKS